MNCKKIAVLISADIDGELNVNEAKLLKSHINTCSECMVKYERFKQADMLLSTNKGAVTPPYFETRVFERIKAKAVESVPDMFGLELRLLFTFAVLLILFSVVTINSYLVYVSSSYSSIQNYIAGSYSGSPSMGILNKEKIELDDIVSYMYEGRV